MSVDLSHSFPLTHENTLWVLHHAPWTDKMKHELYRVSTLESLFHPLGDHIRRVWFMELQSYPLPRHYMKRFGIGCPDDMVCIIIQNFLCQLRQEQFNLDKFVSECKRNWQDRGRDPVTLQKIPPEYR